MKSYQKFSKHQIKQKLLIRLMQKFIISEKSCWEYTGALNSNGYGCITLQRKKFIVHRIAYKFFKGSIKGHIIRHKCDNPICFNPRHLIKGTHQDNVKDRCKRNRSAKGENNGRSKLTEDNVKYIKKYFPNKTKTYLARKFKVDIKVISNILNNKSWKHVK